jgi:hypothetical protein
VQTFLRLGMENFLFGSLIFLFLINGCDSLQLQYKKDRCLLSNEFFIDVKHGAFRGGHCVSHEKLKEVLK